MKTAVLTVSDGVVAGTREDKSGDILVELLEADGYEVERRVVPTRQMRLLPRLPRSPKTRHSCSRPEAPAWRRAT